MLRTCSHLSSPKNNDSDYVEWTLYVHLRALLTGSEAKVIGTRVLPDLEHQLKLYTSGVPFL